MKGSGFTCEGYTTIGVRTFNCYKLAYDELDGVQYCRRHFYEKKKKRVTALKKSLGIVEEKK